MGARILRWKTSRSTEHLKARVDADQTLKLQKAAGNNQYEMQMLVNHHTSRRDGGFPPKKFRRICDLIEEVHNSPLSPQHEIHFRLPSNPGALGEEARLNRFAAFGHGTAAPAVRLP